MIDDLGFDGFFMADRPIGDCHECATHVVSQCWHCAHAARRSARAVAFFERMRCRQAARDAKKREAKAMDDLRTQRLAKLLSVANRLNTLEADVKHLWLGAQTDQESFQRLLKRIESAATYAALLHNRKEQEALND